MSCRYLDMDCYPRRSHFDYFRSLPYPYVGVTVNVDITNFLAFCRKNDLSFYLAFLHAVAFAANGVAELRQRIRENGIVEHSECPTSHIELLENGTYCYCTLHHNLPLKDFFLQAEAARAACRENASIEESEEVESMLFISSLPWLHYTALIQPVVGGDESNPRITWGKYEKDPSGRMLLPVSILAHHALVDGIHLSQFYRNLDSELSRLSSELL